MKEKFFIINNQDRYYIFMKCAKDQLNDYMNYGHLTCLTNEHSIDLHKISNWLINRKIKHSLIMGKISNFILELLVKKDIEKLSIIAQDNDLFISEDEIRSVLKISNEDNKARTELFW